MFVSQAVHLSLALRTLAEAALGLRSASGLAREVRLSSAALPSPHVQPALLSRCLVSVIIPAYNVQETIEDCVRSLLGSALPREQFEILVVDNGSRDRTPAILASYGEELRVLHEPRRGAAAARNRGLRHARAACVAFLDADSTADPRWLPEILPPLDDPSVGIVGGRILAQRPCNSIAAFGERIHDVDFAINVAQPPYVATGNWASRLAVLREVGFFDESLLRSQDVDLSYRIVQAGYRLVYAPHAVVYHLNECTLLGLFREGAVHGYHSLPVSRKHRQFVRDSLASRSSMAEDAVGARSRLPVSTAREEPWRSFYGGVFQLGKRLGRALASLRALLDWLVQRLP
jgi:glycosyltransferase involved in cell wall biosynthesis